jgi:tetratricopeptide (TPR) repeat protein
VTRLLRRPEEAERCFLEAVRHAPFSLDSWLELTRIRGEQGKLEEAEVAARKGLECGKKSARAWANLAAVLIAMGRKEEAQEAAGRSLEIDAGEEVGRRGWRESGGH